MSVYRRGLVSRWVEGLRYGGGAGQWSWLLHRITGLGILLYLVVHIWDTFLVIFSPASYDAIMGFYGGKIDGVEYPLLRWAFRLGELGLFASVVFHAVNGLRVILFDLSPIRAVGAQKELFWAVVALFFFIMIPVTFIVIHALVAEPTPVSAAIAIPRNFVQTFVY